ncbi:MAG TPA: c-type cytochrome [Terracidiphilus sp.]|nr:c-type cytochrome [Terracidiphilus sp.]
MSSYEVATGGNAMRGEQVIASYKCGSCHTIPGIRDANGVFGPPLNKIARRSILAGEFPNEPEILTRWVKSPTTMKPATAMPDLGLTESQARDAAAYLETLR